MKKSVVSLGELCEVQNGFAFDSRFFSQEEKGLPLIRIRDIMRGFSTTYYSGEYDDAYIVNDGDFLIGMDGDFNIGEWHGGEALLNQRVCRLLPKGKILPKFIYYFIPKALQEINAHTSFATVKHLSSKQVRQIAIPLLSLFEQERIVSLLDAEFAKIDTLKVNAERNLQNAKDLFQAALKMELEPKEGWVKGSLHSVCSKIGSGATPLGGKSTYGKEGISLIRSLNVHNNEFHYEDLAHINEEQAQQLSNVEIHEDDVLFNITGASVTRCCKVPKDVIPARVNQHVSILRLVPNTILPSLLVYTLISPNHNTALMKMAENGATRQAITKKQLEDWVIDYPTSITKQQSIVSNLDEINAKCKSLQTNYEKTIALCDDLKQSLLRKAFNGEI